MVTNPRLNNARRNTTNNTCKDHAQPDKKPIRNKHTENTFTVIHQNICSLLNKKEELLNSLIGISPKIVCITEHHLLDEELEGMPLYPCTLVAKCCR